MKKTAAGLIIFTKLPHRGLVAILNKRGDFDYEKMKPESYPGYFEPTICGGIESGEHLIEGLIREAEEEVGTSAARFIKNYLAQIHHVALHESERIVAYTYALYIPHFPLKLLKPHRSSAGIHTISAKNLPDILGRQVNENEKRVAPPLRAIWMHADELEGLKKGFALYQHQPK